MRAVTPTALFCAQPLPATERPPPAPRSKARRVASLLAAVALSAGGRARADTPVLHAGDAETAVARAVAQGAGPAWDLDPLQPAQLLPTNEAGLVGIPSSCQRAPATAADVRRSIELAEGLFSLGKWTAVHTHLTQARAEVACLVDEADAERVAHLHLMAGVVARELDRPEEASAAFDRAQRFGSDPSQGRVLAWPDRLASPDKGQSDLAAAGEWLTRAPVGSIRLAPGVDPGRVDLRIDGRAVPVAATEAITLPVGYHHIQVVSVQARGRSVRTFEIDLQADVPVVVADPRGLASLQLAPHAGTPALADLLRASGLRGPTWVVTEQGTWTLDHDWVEHPPVDLQARQRSHDRTVGRRAAGWTALATGALVGGIAAWGRSTVQQPPAWETSQQQLEWRQAQHRAWVGVGALGLGTSTAGAVLLLRSPSDP